MKNYVRYVIGVLLLIGVIILIVLGFNAIKGIFKSDTKDQPAEVKKVNLIEAGKSGQTVRYTTRGSVVGNEDRRAIRITINQNSRRVEILQGYDDQVTSTEETPNTKEAYTAFIAALNSSGFTNSVSPEGRGDEAQSCPLGLKYNFEVAPDTSDAMRTWSTSCGKKLGTFNGNNSLAQTLFRRQIPNYDKFTYGVQLR